MSEEFVDRNPAATISRPSVHADNSSTQGLSRDQARALLAAARRDGPRSNPLITVLTFTGVRVSEALQTRTSDYGHDAGHRVLSVRRKGGKTAKVAVPAPALEALNFYVGTTGADLVLGQGPGMSWPLFTTATSPGRWREGGRCWPWRRLGAGGDTIPSRCR